MAWAAWVGVGIGVLGAAFGSWCAYRSAVTPEERAYVLRVLGLWTLGSAAFVAALFLLPSPWRHLVWLVYAPALVLGVTATNRGLARARGAAKESP